MEMATQRLRRAMRNSVAEMAVDILKRGRQDVDIRDLVAKGDDPGQQRQLLILGAGQDQGARLGHRFGQGCGYERAAFGAGRDLKGHRQGCGVAQVGQGALGHKNPAGQDQDAVGPRLDLGQRVRGQQDGRAFRRQPVEQFVKIAARHRVKAAGRFIQHQKRGLSDQGLRKANPLAHAFGIGANATTGRRTQTDPLQQGQRQFGAFAAQGQVVVHLFQPGQGGVEGGIFGQVGSIAARVRGTGGGAGHLQFALVIGDQAKDDLHHRRFASAIMPQQSHPLAGGDGQGHIRQRNLRAVRLSQTLQRQCRRHGTGLSASGHPQGQPSRQFWRGFR